MTISRKDFLTRGILAFGRELAAAISAASAGEARESSAERQGSLLYYRERCLVQRGGCFACIDHCPHEAITIRPGVGILVDADKCDGCAACLEYCPVEPRAILLNDKQDV